MKKIIAAIAQFFLFLFIYAVGSFLHPFNMHWAYASSSIKQYSNGAQTTVIGSQTAHFFVPDGLLLAIGVLLAILVIQAIRKRICNTPWTILAFALAIAAGYAMRLGFVTKDLY
jgi:hypothetical protein